MQTIDVINKAAERRGISNAELARRIGMKPELLRRSREGTRKLDCVEFLLICRELNIGLEDFKEVKLAFT